MGFFFYASGLTTAKRTPSCAELANELVVYRDTLPDDAVFLCGLVNLHVIDQGSHDMSVQFLVLSILLRKFIFRLNRLGLSVPVRPLAVKGAKRLFYP